MRLLNSFVLARRSCKNGFVGIPAGRSVRRNSDEEICANFGLDWLNRREQYRRVTCRKQFPLRGRSCWPFRVTRPNETANLVYHINKHSECAVL